MDFQRNGVHPFIKIVGTSMTPKEFDRIKKKLAPVFKQKVVRKAILFGSYAGSSETKRSDLDIMIILDTKKRFFSRYDEFNEIFELIKDKAIDLLIYTPEELENISHRPFIRKIIEEGRVIYEH
jgi:predicted nucleotidyltransferase